MNLLESLGRIIEMGAVSGERYDALTRRRIGSSFVRWLRAQNGDQGYTAA